MPFLTWVWRLLTFSFTLALPFAGLGFVLGHLHGVIVAEAVIFGAVIFAAFWSEKGILSIYQVKPTTPDGVHRSLKRVLAVDGGNAPRVLTFSDPAPQALVVRSVGSHGSILLSEGLLGALSEPELRELLAVSVKRLRSRGIRFQSLCAFLAHHALELAPRSWVELLFGELRWHESLGVFGALRFLVVFSSAKFFVGLGRTTSFNAPHGLTRLPSVSGEVANPGSCILHFSSPWQSRSLFSL